MKEMVTTRFAPSPTGNLHIGGCRTLLYNWLFAKKHNGKLILRIEDTDLKRSTDAALQNILEGIKWLGLNWDDEIAYQSANINRHREIALQLLENGKAYKCYCTEEELGEMREEAIKKKKSAFYNNKWRDREPNEKDKNIKPVIRIKTPLGGITEINDSVQGTVRFENEDLDDFIILRSDESPTYLLASAVDDHDMGVTHIIRGDDHLNNAARQYHIFKAMNWKIPEYTHIPLIHSSDGAKLSKRDGALSVSDYKSEGFLSKAILNYLLRLGWSYGDKEYFSKDEMIKYFDVKNIHKSPARLDHKKLLSINSYYLNTESDSAIIELISLSKGVEIPIVNQEKIKLILEHVKTKSKTLNELIELIEYLLIVRPPIIDSVMMEHLNSEKIKLLDFFYRDLSSIKDWSIQEITYLFEKFTNDQNIKLIDIAKPLRIVLTGRIVPTGIYELIYALGKEDTLTRISQHLYK